MKILNTEIPAGVIKQLPTLFNMPNEIMAKIIYETETVDERNLQIFIHCVMFYVSKKYKLKSLDEFENIMKQNQESEFVDFIEEIIRRMERKWGNYEK
jgi:hypothetical protein